MGSEVGDCGGGVSWVSSLGVWWGSVVGNAVCQWGGESVMHMAECCGGVLWWSVVWECGWGVWLEFGGKVSVVGKCDGGV